MNYVVPSVCILALLFGGFIAINPASNVNKTYADGSNIMAATDPVISLNIAPNTSDSTNTNVTAGEVAYFSNTITVGGTGISKYYLTLSIPSGSTGNLVGQNNPAATIGKVGNNTLPTNFNDNTWGYAISDSTSVTNDNLTYSPVPSGTNSNNTVYLATKDGSPASDGDNYKLVFAAKLGSNMPSDHYKTDVYLSTVANASFVADFGITDTDGHTITKMQDMTTGFCLSLQYGTAGKLMDARDSKVYWVARLNDGNCWMTQNLAYNGGDDDKIGELCTIIGTVCSGWVNNYKEKSVAIGSHLDGDHTSQGNFYNWPAAVQGTVGGEGVQGVCPSGWQLPTSGNADSTKKTFGALAAAYGADTDSDGSAIMRGAPLYFIFSGHIDGNGSLSGSGNSGYFWSSTLASNGNVYNFEISPIRISGLTTNTGGASGMSVP